MVRYHWITGNKAKTAHLHRAGDPLGLALCGKKLKRYTYGLDPLEVGPCRTCEQVYNAEHSEPLVDLSHP